LVIKVFFLFTQVVGNVPETADLLLPRHNPLELKNLEILRGEDNKNLKRTRLKRENENERENSQNKNIKFKFKFKFIYLHLFSYNITTIKNKKEVKNRADYTLS